MGVLYPATFVSGYSANPPPPVEPQIIYIEAEQGTPRLGHTEFDPLLMAQPGRLSPAWPRRLSGPFLSGKATERPQSWGIRLGSLARPSGTVARLGRRSRWSLQDLCYPIA